MASTRTRLTISYLVVVTATLVAFAIALYVARGAEADQDVLEQAASLADDVLATIRNAQLAGKRLTYQEQTEGLPTIRASQEMGEQLDRHPGYFLVLDSLGRLLFSSKYTGAVDATRLVIVAGAARLVFGWTKSFPVSIGRPSLRIWTHGLEMLVLVPLAGILGAQWGATGAAGAVLASSVAYCLYWALLYLRIRREPEPAVPPGEPLAA